jgi:hypothetical protein
VSTHSNSQIMYIELTSLHNDITHLINESLSSQLLVQRICCSQTWIKLCKEWRVMTNFPIGAIKIVEFFAHTIETCIWPVHCESAWGWPLYIGQVGSFHFLFLIKSCLLKNGCATLQVLPSTCHTWCTLCSPLATFTLPSNMRVIVSKHLLPVLYVL